jgi:hypothetical protein
MPNTRFSRSAQLFATCRGVGVALDQATTFQHLVDSCMQRIEDWFLAHLPLEDQM